MAEPLPDPGLPFATTLDVIMVDLLRRLQAVTGFSDAAAFWSQQENMPFDSIGEQYVWLKAEDDSPDQPIWLGSGRVDPREWVVLSATVRTRVASDRKYHDEAWMMNQTKGHTILRHTVIRAFWGYWPTDWENEIPLTVAAIEFLQGRKPAKDKVNSEWGESRLYFRFQYVLNIPQDTLEDEPE